MTEPPGDSGNDTHNPLPLSRGALRGPRLIAVPGSPLASDGSGALCTSRLSRGVGDLRVSLSAFSLVRSSSLSADTGPDLPPPFPPRPRPASPRIGQASPRPAPCPCLRLCLSLALFLFFVYCSIPEPLGQRPFPSHSVPFDGPRACLFIFYIRAAVWRAAHFFPYQ
ncbi:unnamed protein product [Prunus armeniaca]|uniref:Uncharacterized protein n=1 Tax=Prunus armeniaca TaxID=36596 RepID=A0A6J5VX35_PRUAR|nr:unnamed protein product [Prunus armeniaca]